MIKVEGVSKIFGDDPDSVKPLLEQGLSKEEIREQTGHTVGVHDVSFTLKPSEFFCIMGLSGSGKSTLLRCVNRLIEPTSGTVTFQGKDGDVDITAADAKGLRDVRKTHMSMVFQRFGLLPHRTVLDNVSYGLEIQGRPADERKRLAQETLDMVGLGTWANERPGALSGGMQQRVGLARGIATQAEVLLMDEPFSALDPLIKMEMQDEMIRIQKELNRTILFITHDLDEALKLGDRIAIMEGGRVVQLGTPEDIIVNPKTEYVANFVDHADPTGVITAATIALPLTHKHFAEQQTDTSGVREFADRSQPEVVFAVDADNRLVSVTINGQQATVKALDEALAEDVGELRESTVALRCDPATTLRRILRGRTYSSLPTLVMSDDGVVRGIITERALIQGILDKRGHTDTADDE